MSKRSFIGGIILGIVISFFVLPLAFKFAAKNMLFNEIVSSYDFDQTVKLIEEHIVAQPGWNLSGTVDQNAEIVKNGGPQCGKVKIIKLCNAKLSGKMLSKDATRYMATKMPASIAVYEKSDGKTYISVMNSLLMSRLFSGTDEGAIMEQVVRDSESIMNFIHFRFTYF